jgi:hypothetical protein
MGFRIGRLYLQILAGLGLAVLVFTAGYFWQPAHERTEFVDLGVPRPIEQLNSEQKGMIKDAFNLARNLYVQGKYELCLEQLEKIHELTPQYENSRELESFCDQGHELVLKERLLETKERKAAEVKASGKSTARKPASSGSYLCAKVDGGGYLLEDFLNANCNRAKPFSISPQQSIFYACCIAK